MNVSSLFPKPGASRVLGNDEWVPLVRCLGRCSTAAAAPDARQLLARVPQALVVPSLGILVDVQLYARDAVSPRFADVARSRGFTGTGELTPPLLARRLGPLRLHHVLPQDARHVLGVRDLRSGRGAREPPLLGERAPRLRAGGGEHVRVVCGHEHGSAKDGLSARWAREGWGGRKASRESLGGETGDGLRKATWAARNTCR